MAATPVHTTDRGAGPPPAERLGLERTPACALETVDREGVEKPSTRRPARASGHDPMSPYRLPLREFPLPRGLAAELASHDGAAELERGLDITPHPRNPLARREHRPRPGLRPPQQRHHRKEQHRLRPAEHRTTRGEQQRRSS